MNNKNYISIVLFLFIFIGGYIYLEKVFKTPHFYNNSIQDFKELSKKTNIDVIFYGSSHSYKTFNPLVINNKCKTISYNLGSDALALSLTDLVLGESLKYTSPKLVVLEVYPGVTGLRKFTPRFKGYQLRVLDEMPNTQKEFIKTKRFFNNKELITVYSKLIRNHSKWKNVNFLDLDRRLVIKKNKLYYTNGYIGNFKNIKKNSDQYKKYKNFKNFLIKRDSSKSKLSTNTKNELLSFINIAKKNKIRVLIVSAPDLRARTWDYIIFDELHNFCNQNKIDFINLNDFYNEIGIEIDDFQDPGHLNVFGGIKTSKFIANYINKNYKLDNKSKLSEWKQINKEYFSFSKLINSNFAKCNLKLEKELSKNIIITNINLTKEINKLLFKINFDKTKINLKELSKYKLAVRVFPKEGQLNKLSKRSKAKGWLFDKKDIVLLDKPSINFSLNTKVSDIKSIELFLYNKEKYKGVIGKPIYINNIKFIK